MRRRAFITLLGGAASWPLAARAQNQAPAPTIGVLMPLSEQDSGSQVRQAAFEAALKTSGFLKDRNLEIEYRWLAARPDQLSGFLADLLRRRVSVIVTPGNSATALAAKAATTTIPVVFSVAADPVQIGLVASLNRPGGNVTGVSYVNSEISAKRLELLREMVGNVSLVAVLASSSTPGTISGLREVEVAANALGQKIEVIEVADSRGIAEAFATFAAHRAGAVFVTTGNLFNLERSELARLAAKYGIPASYSIRDYVEVGGLMSYGASLTDSYRLAGLYTGRILKGDRPADLPVQQSSKFDLVINLKTAKALGLTVPSALLAIADEVIE
jgi:putative tryptophan/tyrosine transport system substrate-binding protein